MLRFTRMSLAIATAAMALVAPLAALADATVQVTLTARHVSGAHGKEVFTAADQARPGDVLEYRTTCRNTTGTAVRQVMAVLPLPAGVEYVPGSATPAAVEASLDGRTFEPVPVMRRVRAADGRSVMREVPASEYRALRWSVGQLGGGAERTVTARARISPLQASLVR
jgi:uncharacterized repeat protein (TIGR01451 family)